LTWFYQEPKKYEGGDLILKDEDDILNIESLNNRLLIFPSRIWHQVTPIKFNGTKMTDGRYCMTQFLHHD
jgi:predicted 2-oxoglutarate/Fe(II)-dependent dioxygenase YbiX